jgi:exodeoxyribonuclease X
MTTIRIFDVETTGVDPKEHRVIEIAAYDLDVESGAITRVGSHLCNPGRAIPPEASAVHHLTDADVANAPPFGAVWAEHFAGGSPTIYAAHNCEFEQGFIPTPEGTQWICTYKCALRRWPEAPGHSNQVLRYFMALDEIPEFDRALAGLAHRAEPDTYVTAWILRRLLGTVADLVRQTAEPKHYTKLNFGKHRGMKLTEAPADYLGWLRDGRHDMDADWRHCAKLELERRAGR